MTTLSPALAPSATSAASPAVNITQISPAEAQAMLASNRAVLIDVREPDEYARERIAGARLLPLSRFNPADVLKGLAPGQRVVLHCKSGKRSADAASACVDSGIPVLVMLGGLEAWKAANLPTLINTSVTRISIMRQVQLVVGSLTLVGSALAWFVHPAFIALPAFLGAGLTFAGASGTCALATLLSFLPWNREQSASCGV